MKEKTFIYALSNPETNEVFYVGKADSPKKRLQNHIHTMKSFFDVPELYQYMKAIFDAGKLPDLLVLEEVDQSKWEEKEIKHIAEYRQKGINLLNSTAGGRVFGKECHLRRQKDTRKPILQYSLEGKYVKEFDSIASASKALSCGKSTIHCSLNTKHKTAKGFYWRFKINDEIPEIITPQKYSYTLKPIFNILLSGEKVWYESIRAAAKGLNIKESYLSHLLRRNTTHSKYGKFEKDMSSKRWKQPHGKLNQKLINYHKIDPTEYSQFSNQKDNS